jgi:hypothetical protein
MDDSSPRLVIFCGISEKSRELRRKVPVHDAELSSRGLQQGMAIWRMTSASHDDRQKQAVDEARTSPCSTYPGLLSLRSSSEAPTRHKATSHEAVDANTRT